MKCAVCGDTDIAGVASSPLAAVSYAYCKRCAAEGYEPWGSLVMAVQGDMPLSDYTLWFRELVKRNLKFHKKSWEDLQKESKEAWEDYYKHIGVEDER